MLNKARSAARLALRRASSASSASAGASSVEGSLGAATLRSVGLWLGGWAVVTGAFTLVCVGAASQAFPGEDAAKAGPAASTSAPAAKAVSPAAAAPGRAGGRT